GFAAGDADPATFALTVTLATGEHKRFAYTERGNGDQEKGLVEFLRDPMLSGDASAEELGFLKSLRFDDRRPTALYYYRELQNLRDPLHFREGSAAAMHKRRNADDVEKQMQLDSRKRAAQRWAKNKIARHKKTKS